MSQSVWAALFTVARCFSAGCGVRHPIVAIGLAGVLLTVGPGVRASDGQTLPIPQKALWESQMVEYGQRHCDALIAAQDGPIDAVLGPTYYDATKVYYKIGDYTGQASWTTCAQA